MLFQTMLFCSDKSESESESLSFDINDSEKSKQTPLNSIVIRDLIRLYFYLNK